VLNSSHRFHVAGGAKDDGGVTGIGKVVRFNASTLALSSALAVIALVAGLVTASWV
jgi:hypothetical protein